jgi:integrase
LQSKKWQATYVGPDKTRHNAPRTFFSRSQASDWLKREESQIVLGQWVSPGKPTGEVAEEVEHFLEYAERHIKVQTVAGGKGLRASTQELYGRLLRNHLTTFHSLPLGKITVMMVNDWWARQLDTKKFTTSAKAYSLLSAVMARAVREDVLRKNPCQVRGARVTKTGLKIVIPSVSEVEQLCEISEHNFGLMVSLMSYAGLRFGECVSLKVSDFEPFDDDSGNRIYKVSVSKSATVVNREVLVGPPKTKRSVRKIWIHQSVSNRLAPFIESRINGTDELAFPSPSGKIWRNDSFHRVWKRMLAKSGIHSKRITPHSLRHFGATLFHAAGGGIPELKTFMGDSSTSAVVGYLHETDNQLEIVQRMSSWD